MMRNIRIEPGSSLLFVCYGNICRSPMAEGLAKEILGDEFHVESAGVHPLFGTASKEAALAVQDLFKIDISHHTPRHVEDVLSQDFNYIIALDSSVYELLKESHEILPQRMILWDIEDPYSKPLAAYKKCARQLHHHLKSFLLV
jgi:protein-tyrosine phosphatase